MPDGGAWKELMRAASENQSSLVAYHLSRDIDPNFQHPEYFTCPLFGAIRAGHLQICQQLVDGGASIVTPEELSGSTPLEVAVEEKQHEIVDFFLEQLPQNEKESMMTILVSGHAWDKRVLQGLASMGHIIWIDDESADEKIVHELQLATKNKKIQLANMVSRELAGVTHWIVREEANEERRQLLPYMLEYAPLMTKLQRAIVLKKRSQSISTELAWLLSRNSNTAAFVERTSWWDSFVAEYVWAQTREQTLWWLLTTFDSVEGSLYNYQRNIVTDYNASDVPSDQLEGWDAKFKSLVNKENTVQT